MTIDINIKNNQSLSTSEDDEHYYHFLLILPLAFALLYAVSVQIFLAAWHECSWMAHSKQIILRLAVLGVAHSLVSCSSSSSDGDGELTLHCNVGNETIMASTFVPSLIVLTLMGGILIYQTRMHDIQGPKPKCPNMMDGRVVLITGANTGIGRETARQLLLQTNAIVIFACRNEARAKEAMDDIIASSSSSSSSSSCCFPSMNGQKGPQKSTLLRPITERMRFLRLDLTDLSSIRTAVRKFHEMNLPLHVLINNAGIMMKERQLSKTDGYELTMQANHLGHFLLTNLLLPKLRMHNTNSRVITLTSSTYVLASGGLFVDDLNCAHRPYTLFGQYAQSKLANILFVKELARRENEYARAVSSSSNGGSGCGGSSSTSNGASTEYTSVNGHDRPRIEATTTIDAAAAPVLSYAVHPGLVRTDVVRNMPWYLYYPNIMFGFILATLQKTPEAGAYTSVWCATSDDVVRHYESGTCFVNSKVYETNEFTKDEMTAARLWEISEKLVGLK